MRKIINSKAFQRGALKGFMSPFAIMAGSKPVYTFKRRDLVAVSWRQVGASLQSALAARERPDGEAARPPARKAS